MGGFGLVLENGRAQKEGNKRSVKASNSNAAMLCNHCAIGETPKRAHIPGGVFVYLVSEGWDS